MSFTYPGTRQPVLKEVSFALEVGRHYALVGANGSGKSTIAKLIMGLYRPDGGQILINGTSIAGWPQDALNGLFGVVFQDFARYSLTIRDNVAAAGRLDDAAVQASLAGAGLGDDFAQRLPLGYDTPLGKVLRGGVNASWGEWQRLAMARSLAADAPVRILLSREFGTRDLSLRQWQRVAIARGLFREHDLILLDEPTASIDPLEEQAVYERFMEMAAGRTAILVTHRLGSARLADRILVMRDGRIVEDGTHERLLERRGLYHEMFTAQAAWYERRS